MGKRLGNARALLTPYRTSSRAGNRDVHRRRVTPLYFTLKYTHNTRLTLKNQTDEAP